MIAVFGWSETADQVRTASGGRGRSADLFTRISRGGLAQTPAHGSARLSRLRRLGRQVDVAAVGEFKIPQKDTSITTLDDVSRAVGEMAGETTGLAHDTLA
jgi:hypothetical protein